ncbi:TetR/AcrR family transcriptional regulator [Amnibacterium setariae]|uniref:TetR/AcrR family transcriptional regulator n=1 Tax=Amnibacterium setariae TaxID=2306585 RepID=A0A3A1U7V2_9MICO|nr:TetR/AcrR family transcriptional regulator [Amnibacterium setariae]
MTSSQVREPRSDAARNRKQLLEVATRVLATAGAETSMRAIAREAGVGVATLYRHFPTRESLVDAVYRDQVERLTTGAGELLARLPPRKALREWMDLFGDWIATKNGMLDTMAAMIEAGELAHAQTRTELLTAIDVLLDAGREAGQIREHVTADDIAAGLIGIFTVAHPPELERAERLLDIFSDGLRPPD